jgi:hypothetical protein
MNALPDGITLNVRSVNFDFNILVRAVSADGNLELEGVLRVLQKWSQLGRLKEITLFLRDKDAYNDTYSPHDLLLDTLDLRRVGAGEEPVLGGDMDDSQRTLYPEYLEVLESAGGKDGYLRHLKRNLVINTGLPGFAKDGTFFRSIPSTLGNPENMHHELNKAWGGTLEMNEVLCYRDSQHVSGIFRTLLVEGQELFYYHVEVFLFYIAFYYSLKHGLSAQTILEKMLVSDSFRLEAGTWWTDWSRTSEGMELNKHNFPSGLYVPPNFM